MRAGHECGRRTATIPPSFPERAFWMGWNDANVLRGRSCDGWRHSCAWGDGVDARRAAAATGGPPGPRAKVIAAIDPGIDYTHSDLAANVWSAPPGGFSVTINGQTTPCPAGTHGFNAITNPPPLNRCDPYDDHAHGTHVSGTIGTVG